MADRLDKVREAERRVLETAEAYISARGAPARVTAGIALGEAVARYAAPRGAREV